MTSTVLDVTVFLLCLSAGAGVLANAGAVGGGSVAASPDAAAVANVVAGSTATVEYRPTPNGDTASDVGSSGRNATAVHHATLAELVARAAALESVGRRGSTTDYPAEVRETVGVILHDLHGGRIRLTAHPPVAETGRPPFVVGAEPPSDSDVDVAVVTAPGALESTGPGAGTDPAASGTREREADSGAENRDDTENPGAVRIVVEVW